MPGFMGPEEALQDAYADLKSHQDCVVAGMQGAIAAALQKLAPEAVAGKPGLTNLVPLWPKAAYWDRYCTLHASLAQGARSELQDAFVKAYEKHLERVQDEAANG
jgi:FHA domain-containing protein